MTAIAFILALAWQEAPAPAEPASAVRQLIKEYQSVEAEFMKTLRAAAPEEQQRLWRDEMPAAKYTQRFLDLSRQATGEEAAEALAWTFRLGSRHPKGDFAMKEAAEELLAAHAGSPKLAEVAQGLQYRRGEWIRPWLVTAMETAGDRKAKAAAMFTFAVTAGRATEDKEEARRLLVVLQKNYADTPGGQRAGSQLFEMENLQIGCKAPDFDAKDVDGVAFKLSDYRGKVVVLDFWGFW